MSPRTLPEDAIARHLAVLPNWRREGDEIVRTFDCGNFNGSIGFVNAIAAAANAADHHPDLAISWNDVRVALTSHDARGLTERDFALAAEIDRLAR